jgi:hypothetical protein
MEAVDFAFIFVRLSLTFKSLKHLPSFKALFEKLQKSTISFASPQGTTQLPVKGFS